MNDEGFLFTFPVWMAVKQEGNLVSVLINRAPDKPGTGVSIFTDEDLGNRFLKSKESEPKARAYHLLPIPSEKALLEHVLHLEQIGISHVIVDAAKRAEYIAIADLRKTLEAFLARNP